MQLINGIAQPLVAEVSVQRKIEHTEKMGSRHGRGRSMPPQQIDHGIGNENADVGDRHPHKMVLTAYIHAVPCGSGVIAQDQQHYDPDGIDFYVRRHFQIHYSSPKRWGLPSLISPVPAAPPAAVGRFIPRAPDK